MSTISISATVGLKATNNSNDVVKVQVMLNHFIGNKKILGYKSLKIDGNCGPKTREVIAALQFQNGLLSEEHFKNQIYRHGKTIEFMNKNAGYIPTWELSDPATGPTLLQLLEEVRVDDLANAEVHRKNLGGLQRFFLRGLEGNAVDDQYWTFTYYDGLGRKYPCYAKHSVDSVERSNMKQKALLVFQKDAQGATTKEAVGKALRRIEETVACNTFVLTRWLKQNNALGDAPLTDYTEMTYIRDVVQLVTRREPESIYAVYADELAAAYPFIRPIFNADLLWRMRRANRQ